eukprot:1211555-Amphidinium_carterae.2
MQDIHHDISGAPTGAQTLLGTRHLYQATLPLELQRDASSKGTQPRLLKRSTKALLAASCAAWPCSDNSRTPALHEHSGWLLA